MIVQSNRSDPARWVHVKSDMLSESEKVHIEQASETDDSNTNKKWFRSWSDLWVVKYIVLRLYMHVKSKYIKFCSIKSCC